MQKIIILKSQFISKETMQDSNMFTSNSTGNNSSCSNSKKKFECNIRISNRFRRLIHHQIINSKVFRNKELNQ